MPGVMLGDVGEHPIFIKEAKDSRLTDVDDNKYIDFVMGYGPIILGYGDPIVNNAVCEQLKKGQLFGLSSELEVDVAKKIVNDIPCADLAFVGNTGSEATLMAIRLARAFTGKDKIVKFDGCFHGWHDWTKVGTVYSCTYYGNPRGGTLLSPIQCMGQAGIPSSIVNDYIVLTWNEVKAMEKILRRKKDEIAGVIVEPTGPYGSIMPEEGFLELIRELTEELDIIFIFDEVKTSFRLALGGYQERYSVLPDIWVGSKAMANGFPVSAVGGKECIMNLKTQGIVPSSGTFSANPISMAASLATLNELEKPNRYEYLYMLTNRLANGMHDAIKDTGIEAILVGPGVHNTKPGPMLDIFFTDRDHIKDAKEMKEAKKDIHVKRRKAFVREMVKRGIHIAIHNWFISFCHTKEDIDKAIQSVDESLRACKRII